MKKILSSLLCLSLLATTVFADSETVYDRLQDLSDVAIVSPSNGQTIAYNGPSQKWVNSVVSESDGVVGNEVTNATNSTLTRAGSGTAISPYTMGLNLANSNTWTAKTLVDLDSVNESSALSVTHDYSGSGVGTATSSILNIPNNSGNETYSWAGLYSAVTDDYDYSGTIEDVLVEKSGLDVSVYRTGDSSVDWQDGEEELRIYNAYMQMSGSYTGLHHRTTQIGFNTKIFNDVSYNNASANHTQIIYGQNMLVQSNGASVAGTLAKEIYGIWVSASASGGDTNKAYAIFIAGAVGSTEAYAIYSSTTAPSYLAGDFEARDVKSGTYTPTLTNVANLSASTAYSCQWLRVGDSVTVSGRVDIDPTLAATSTQLGISLPVASALANANEVGGTAFATSVAGQGAAVLADATNDRAQMQYVSGDVTNQAMYFQFTYRVI